MGEGWDGGESPSSLGLGHVGYVVLERDVGGGGAGARALGEGQAQAHHHDVLPLLDVPVRLNIQLSAEAYPPLSPVRYEKAACVGAVPCISYLAIGVGQLHLL